VDAQGYIAHNDNSIVISYQCCSSFLDWMTKYEATSVSEWNLNRDFDRKKRVRSRHYNCWCGRHREGMCCDSSGTTTTMDETDSKLRVHTGSYKNFLATLPAIQSTVEPILKESSEEKTLYIVGHSFGGAVATLAAMYFLLETNFNDTPHRLVCVTTGSSRVCESGTAELVNQVLIDHSDKVSFCRVKCHKDIVTSVPTKCMDFHHVGQLVYITKTNAIKWCRLRYDRDDEGDLEQREPCTTTHRMTTTVHHHHVTDEPSLKKRHTDDNDDDEIDIDPMNYLVPLLFNRRRQQQEQGKNKRMDETLYQTTTALMLGI